MKTRAWQLFANAAAVLIFLFSCKKPSTTVTELKHYPVESLEGVITRSYVAFDKEITSDGNGSLRITANQPTTIRPYETGDIDVENGRLTYQAKIRTEDIQGKVYLAMWCQFQGQGEFFSRDLSSPLSGTTDWSTEETPFFLKKGENSDNVKINLVIDGNGTAWIDDVHLFKGPLQEKSNHRPKTAVALPGYSRPCSLACPLDGRFQPEQAMRREMTDMYRVPGTPPHVGTKAIGDAGMDRPARRSRSGGDHRHRYRRAVGRQTAQAVRRRIDTRQLTPAGAANRDGQELRR